MINAIFLKLLCMCKSYLISLVYFSLECLESNRSLIRQRAAAAGSSSSGRIGAQPVCMCVCVYVRARDREKACVCVFVVIRILSVGSGGIGAQSPKAQGRRPRARRSGQAYCRVCKQKRRPSDAHAGSFLLLSKLE